MSTIGNQSAVPAQFAPPPPAGVAAGQYKKRTGLVPLRVGASFLFRCQDGKSRQFEVKSRRIEMAKLEAQGRKDAKVVCRCMECKRNYGSLEELAADIERHPSAREMEQKQEAHTYAYFCDELETKEAMDEGVRLDKQIGALQRSLTGLTKSLDKVEDAEEYEKVNARLAKIQGDIKALASQKSAISEKRIGLMSDVEAA
jgi:hypothetical protein